MTSAANILQEVEAFVEPPFFSFGPVRHLGALSEQLPPWLSAFYLECRLGAEEGGEQWDLLGAVFPQGELVFSQKDHCGPVWTQAWHQIKPWLSGSKGASSTSLWLEFDGVSDGASPRFGNLHICTDVGYRPAAETEELFNAAQATQLLKRMQETGDLKEQEVQVAMACLQHLPNDGRLIHVSAMSRRTPRELKLYLEIPSKEVDSYLDAIGMGQSLYQKLTSLSNTGELLRQCPRLYLDITWTVGDFSRLGIVFSQPNRRDLNETPQRTKILAALRTDGLCNHQQLERLHRWVSPPLAPPCLNLPLHRLVRWLDLKVTASHGTEPTAKAYLGFAPIFSMF